MNEPETFETSGSTDSPDTAAASSSDAQRPMIDLESDRREARRWWIKLIVQPILLLVIGAVLIIGLGVAQRMGFITGGGSHGGQVSNGNTFSRYICPMMCTPPQSEPGRCPVCAMELVPATAGSGSGGSLSIEIDPAARRVANIETAEVRSMPMARTIRAVGELNYDEGSLKTISAYVDGRLDRLYADYTGVVVNKGDHLALVYSPRLYSGQVEYLLAKKSREDGRNSTLTRVVESNEELLKNARQRLIELGMTESQIDQLEEDGEANSRLHLCAPISGTVIQRLAAEGQYVKEGQAIYQLADLSTVWLMLQLFPEDAAAIRYGQKVEAEVQSLPGQKFTGRVAFVDPSVDSKTRTVGVRVVIPNSAGVLRVGDYAKAEISVPLATIADGGTYDPELADMWISPRHPHVVRSEPGQCPVCNVDLVPAAKFGFMSNETDSKDSLVVPRNAVLMAGANSVVYVEVEPGRFELRSVVLGPKCGDEIVITSGVKAGEMVATRGNFLIDSQMQLAGNPSLIDPTKAIPRVDNEFEMTAEMIASISELPEADRKLAVKQLICPVTKFPLGSMGIPPKVVIDGKEVFICCEGCKERLQEDPKTHLENLKNVSSTRSEDATVLSSLVLLTPADQKTALKQKLCPVADFRLGSMGKPIKVDVDGNSVFICCEGCRESLLEEPQKYLDKLAAAKQKNKSAAIAPNLPPISAIRIAEPKGGLPTIGDPQPIIEPSPQTNSGLPPIGPLQPIEGAEDTEPEVNPLRLSPPTGEEPSDSAPKIDNDEVANQPTQEFVR
ncbi:MAG: Cu(I)/Ag(I) efflux system membrane fusion protein [Pirellulaceae bacterium]|jgi:Cu(I)/Ag(I) efflux system membrane fusion protein